MLIAERLIKRLALMECAAMITLIGVGHVFAISESVKGIIRSKHPEIVCLELDNTRFSALQRRQTSGSAPLQYRLLAYFQKRMADKFGTEVGEEMLAAAAAAQEVNAKVALIDMDAAKMFALLWRRMSFRERLTLFTASFAGLFLSKKRVEEEIEKYESQEEQYMEVLSQGFPTIKEVLIDDRNRFMTERISALAKEYSSIVAVVGDGHISGLVQMLGQTGVEVIRLKDLMNHAPDQKGGASEFKSSFWYETQ